MAVAILFAFNAGRSRTTWQGFSFRWFTGDRFGSVLHDPDLQSALKHTLLLAIISVVVATPLGVTLAMGLQRWRGRGSGTVNILMLLPLVTPEIVMGVSLLLLFLQVFTVIGLGTAAQAIGQITFTISYVVVIVRGRLVSIGPEYEEAAADLGAPAHDVLFRVLLPLLSPAILASAAIVFALSIDDFVITQYLSSDASTTTVSMLLYSSARGAPTPALNALATVALVITLGTLALTFLVYRRFAGARASPAHPRWLRWRSDGGPARRDPAREARQELRRRRRRRRRHRPAHATRRVLHHGRPVRLRQDDDAAHDRGLRAADERPHPARRRGRREHARRTSATSTRCSRATRCSRT